MLAGAPVAPTITRPNEADAILNTPYDFTGLSAITVGDPSYATEEALPGGTSDSLTLTVPVQDGTLKFTNTINCFVVGNGTNTVTLRSDPTDTSGLADLNADLPSLVFTPTTGFVGDAFMTITAADSLDGLFLTKDTFIDVTTFTGLTPAQLSEAYGLDNVRSGPSGTIINLDGYGQTIAVIEEGDDPYFVNTGDTIPTPTDPTVWKTSDLYNFDNYFTTFNSSGSSNGEELGAIASSFAVYGENGGPRPSFTNDPGDYAETAEDVEWAHVMAPEAAIDLIEVAGGTTADYATALQTAHILGASVVVMSSFNSPDNYAGQFNILGLPESDFQVAGMTVVSNSGDNGENSYSPGAYPEVVDVASSDLTINSNNSWSAETAWSDTASGPANDDIGGSAGGYSIFPTPAYQQGITISDGNQTLSNNGERTTPDVSIAGGNNGLDYISAGGYFSTSADDSNTGTELAADEFAGLVADADEGLEDQGVAPLSGLQTLGGLYTAPSQDYHDIVNGYNGYSAGPGYDLVSGLGTPIANQLIANVIESQSTATTPLYAPLNYEAPQVYASATTTSGGIGEYTLNGDVTNSALVTGLDSPGAVVTSGSDVFVVNSGAGTIAEYTTAGKLVNATLVSGLVNPVAIALSTSGTDLFVVSQGAFPGEGTGSIAEYTTAGAVVKASLVSGLGDPTAIAISGTDIFITDGNAGTIAEYTTAGVVVNASLVTGLDDPSGIVISSGDPNTAGDLFVTNQTTNSVGEYVVATGAAVNASLLVGLDQPTAIAQFDDELFVANSGTGGIGQYYTEGNNDGLGGLNFYSNNDFIGGLDQPGGIAISSGGNLFVTSAGAPLPNNMTLEMSGSKIELFDNNTSSAGLGTLVAIGSTPYTSQITINGAENTTNNLTVNFSGGNPIPAAGLDFDGQSFEGGTIGQSTLTLTGTLASPGITNEVIRPKTATGGLITINGLSNINYADLTNPIIDTVPASNVTYTALGGSNNNPLAVTPVTLPGGVAGTKVYGTTGLFIPDEFANKTNVTFTDSDANDVLNLYYNSGDPLPAAGLTFKGGTGVNQVNVTGNSNFTLGTSLTDTSVPGGGLSLANVQQFTINVAGAGNNTVNVTNGWKGAAIINGNTKTPGGIDTVVVTKTVGMGMSGNVVGAQDGMALTLNSINDVDLDGTASSTAAMVYTIATTLAGNVFLTGGGGANYYRIGIGNLNTVLANVTVTGVGSSNNVLINDSTYSSPANYTLSGTSVTSKAQSGTARTFGGVTLGALVQNLTLSTSLAADNITLTPAAVTSYIINGDTSTVVPGDKLTVNMTNALSPTLIDTNGKTNGFLTFSNAANVQFSNVQAPLYTSLTTVPPVSTGVNAIGSDNGTGSLSNVAIIDPATDAVIRTISNIYPGYTGGVRVAVGVLFGGGIPDVVVAPGLNEAPLVKIYNALTGAFITEFMAQSSTYKSGIVLAVGDVNGDGKPDIITAPSTGAANVNIFLNNGSSFSNYSANTPTIKAFSTLTNYVGGVGGLAIGSVNGGTGDILVGSGIGTTAAVQVYSYPNDTLVQVINPTFSPAVIGGVSVAIADINGDGTPDVIIGAGTGGLSKIDVWSGTSHAITQSIAFSGTGASAPLRVAIAQINGENDVIVTQGVGNSAHQLETYSFGNNFFPTLIPSLVDTVLQSWLQNGIWVD